MNKNVFQKNDLSVVETDRIIQMAWEDRSPFDAITTQFGMSEKEVIGLMRGHLTASSFKRWRIRVTGRKTKHKQKRNFSQTKFKSALQRQITHNKISKR